MRETGRQLPDPETEPTISPERMALIMGVSRAHIYELIRARDPSVPVIRLGGRYVIPTIRVLKMLNGPEAA